MNTSLIKQYLDKQVIKVIKVFEPENNKVKYSEKIKAPNIEKISGDEEIVRAYLLTKLVNELGYKPENIELEKTYDVKVGRDKKAPRIDILVKDEHENPFLFIEVKAPEKFEEDKKNIEGQLFELADQEEKKFRTKVKYLLYYSIEFINNKVIDNFILIDRSKTKNFSDWEEQGKLSHSDIIPKNYGKPEKRLLTNKDLKILDKENLSKIRKNIHNTLWSAGVEDNEAYLFLVKYLLTKIYDEQNIRSNDPLVCQIYDEDFKNEKGLFERINKRYFEALRKKLNYTEKDLETTGKILSQEKIPLKSLYFLVQELEKYSFSKSLKEQKDDILGAFFEDTNREKFKQDKGQFFTSTNIVKFLIYGLKLDKLAKELFEKDGRLPYAIDPSTGSGTFLIELMKVITNEFKKYDYEGFTDEEKDKYDKLFPERKPNSWAEKYLYGIDNSYSLAISTKVNMILHGDGSSKIIKHDGIVNFQDYRNIEDSILTKYKKANTKIYGKDDGNFLVTENFDIVLSNPPFSVKPIESEDERVKHFLFGDKKNSENLFIERFYQLLKPQGRLGVVLPESVFDTTENKYIRLFIYKYFNVKAVISLPQVAFEPFTSTKTSLLFAQKKTKEEIEQWNQVWKKYSDEWNNLKTRCENLVKVYIDGKDRNKLPSIKNLTEQEEKEILTRMLKDYIEDEDQELSVKELVEKYQDELVGKNGLCKYDKDTKDVFGFVNTWWVFGEVAKELNYKIFMAEVENVGYKRTKRGEKPMPNELYRTDDRGEILVDDGVKETALDYLREVEWE